MKNELDKAIEVLRKEFEKASKQTFVYNPIAYALYHTWKYFDKRGTKKRRDPYDE